MGDTKCEMPDGRTLLLVLLSAAGAAAVQTSVLPKPQSQHATGLSHQVNAASFNDEWRCYGPQGEDMCTTKTAAGRLLSSMTFRYRKMILNNRPASESGDILSLTINITTPSISIKTLETDESYKLTIAAPIIEINADNVFGALYALESMNQLIDDQLFVN